MEEDKTKQSDLEKAIDNGIAKLVGEGDWVKDSCYRVYEYLGKFYSVIVYDSQSMWFLENSMKEIKATDIDLYVNRL
jgi:hypothetical protein